MMLRGRIGVCSDVHGRHDRLLTVLGAMAAAGVDERWCLGDLVGSEPVTPELVGAARQLDLLIAGNHDAWVLGPDRVTAHGRDVFRLARRAMASRHGIDCWHGSPRHPLLGFLTEASAARVTARPPRARSASSAIPMNRRSSPTTAPRRARCAPSPASRTTGSGRRLHGQPGGGRRRQPRDAASWWLIVDIDARASCDGSARSSSPKTSEQVLDKQQFCDARVRLLLVGFQHASHGERPGHDPEGTPRRVGIGAGTEVAFERADDAIVVRKVEGGSNRAAGDGEPAPRSGRYPAQYGGDHGAHVVALIHGFRELLVDSNVLLDVITEDETWLEWSSSAAARAADDGPLFINPIIYAEVSVRFSRIEDVEEALPAADYGRLTIPWESAFLAGKAFHAYRRNKELGRRRSRTSSSAPTPPLRNSGCLPAVTPRGTAPTSPVQLTSPDKT